MKRLIYLFILCLLPTLLIAQSAKKKSELERLRKETQSQIQETTRMISTTKESTLSSLNRLNLMSQEITSRRRLIATLNQELDINNA